MILFFRFMKSPLSFKRGKPLSFGRGFLFIAFLIVFFAAPSLFADPARLGELAESREWQSLLFYSPRVLRSSNGLVDAEAFYLHPKGKSDPRAELEATLARFQAEEGLSKDDPNDYARCRFPARYDFLKKRIPGLAHSHMDCPWIKDYFNAVEPEGVSLVFSSFYLNNPSSMMGHTFIRFQRRSKSGELRSSYLDYVVNFAANADTTNPILYTYKGLTGNFPGTFSLLPYYLKIGEYVNQESRDLWEYELNFSDDEVLALFLSVLEVGPHPLDYFYIDENCSYIMLFLLDAAKPSLDLKSQFHWIVTPTDTLRAVYQSGLVKNIRPIPSQRVRFQTRYDRLSDKGKRVLREMTELSQTNFDEAALKLLADLPEEERVDVLDTFLDYVSFVEKLAGEKKPVRYQNAFAKTLEWRSRLKVTSQPIVFEPGTKQQPHLAHDSKRVLLGVRQQQSLGRRSLQDKYVLFGLRPNLHDVETDSGGYPAGVGIELGQTLLGLRLDNQALELLQFRLFDIRSTQEQSFSNKRPSWGLAFGYDGNPIVNVDEIDPNGAYFFSGEVGLTTSLFRETQLLSFLVSPELQYRPWKDDSFFFTLHAGPDLLLYLGNGLCFSAYLQLGASSEKQAEAPDYRYGTSTRLYLWDGWEFGLKVGVDHNIATFDAHAARFF